MSLVSNSYGHCVTEMHIGVAQAAEAAVESAHDFLAKLAAGAQEVLDKVRVDKIWERLLQGISAHDIAKYRVQIAAKLKEGA